MAMSAGNVQVCSSAPEESSISVCFEKKFESSKHKTPGGSCQLDVNHKDLLRKPCGKLDDKRVLNNTCS